MSRTACLLLALVAAHAAPVPENQVTLPFGVVRGNLNQHAREFLGLPFAAPPRRFEPPSPWTDSYPSGGLLATSYTPICVQPAPQSALDPEGPQSEDCLHLNVFTPRGAPERSRLPVMVWIHGGALKTGSAMMPSYNGSILAGSQQVVVVAINYRLSALGFLPVELPNGALSANNGFRDQQMGLRWVQQHIEAFGGDPAHVTLFGESAGGQSIGVHLTSPGSRGLFMAAIIESGDVTNTRSLQAALAASNAVREAVSCSDYECLLKANASALVSAMCGGGNQKVGADPRSDMATIDGQVIPADPLALVLAHNWSKVPVLLGNNADEGSLFIYPYTAAVNHSLSAEQARCILTGAVGHGNLSVVEALYPLLSGANNLQSIIDIFSDSFMHCGNRRLARAMASTGAAPWVYSFKRSPACPMVPVPGAAHAFEIGYVFNTLNLAPNCAAVPPVDTSLASQMSALWGEFGRTNSLPWGRFEAASEPVAKLDVGLSARSVDTEGGYRRGQCDALDKIGIGSQLWRQLLSALFSCMPSSVPLEYGSPSVST